MFLQLFVGILGRFIHFIQSFLLILFLMFLVNPTILSNVLFSLLKLDFYFHFCFLNHHIWIFNSSYQEINYHEFVKYLSISLFVPPTLQKPFHKIFFSLKLFLFLFVFFFTLVFFSFKSQLLKQLLLVLSIPLIILQNHFFVFLCILFLFFEVFRVSNFSNLQCLILFVFNLILLKFPYFMFVIFILSYHFKLTHHTLDFFYLIFQSTPDIFHFPSCDNPKDFEILTNVISLIIPFLYLPLLTLNSKILQNSSNFQVYLVSLVTYQLFY